MSPTGARLLPRNDSGNQRVDPRVGRGMKTRLLSLASLPLLAALLGACGDGSDNGSDDGSDGGTGPGASADGIEADELTRNLGCGFGFSRADEAGRTLLRVSADPETGELDRRVTFPDPGWTAEVRVGEHLTANWCTDVIEEPQAEVDETWQIVEGTLEFVGTVPSAEWADNPETIRADLTDVVVQSPDGDSVELGDFSLENHAWGFLPG